MRTESYQQYAIVAADSAQELTEQLNEKLKTLKCKYPKVTFEGLIARIQYTESVQIVEELSDEYELQGVRLTCQDCPMFQPLLNRTAQKTNEQNGEIVHLLTSGERPGTQALAADYLK